MLRLVLAVVGLVWACAPFAWTAEPAKLRVLMLGDDGHHRPAQMAKIITPVLARENIEVTYSNDARSLNPQSLAATDCVLIFRDSGELPADSEAALVRFVEEGRGLVALHCASHTFRNSNKYTALVGGRFLSHGTGVFRTRIVDAQHAALRGVKSFECWDETYLHNELSGDRVVLMVRDHEQGSEPWTWVRQQGKGRVFYTASGHDERCWESPGYQELVKAGLLWAAGRVNDDLPPQELTDAGEGLPNYLPGQQWGTEGERLRRMPKPLPPTESIRHLHMPEGFRAELFASEPQVVKPIATAFDERGRLWVVESVDYPNNLLRNPEQNGNDRIKILEDADGDGRVDKVTQFADKLNIPTGIVVVKGGAIVAVAPHILFLQDADGDDRCDRRTVLYTGFGRGDTHAVHSNFRYGLDNWIWATVGYSGGMVKAGDQPALSFRQGVIRFKADGSAFEVLTPTSNNTWGLGIGEENDVFISTANNEHSVHLAVPNRFFESVRGWHGVGSGNIADHRFFHPASHDVRQMDHHGRFTAAAGHDVYTARSLPSAYWNRAAFVCEPTGRLVHTNWLEPVGSGFVAHDGFNLLASTDPWTAPVSSWVGPDGAVWVADWYNFIVQHNPTPRGFRTGAGAAYVTALRDQQHGRIYRITHESGKPSARHQLDRSAPAGLLAALASDNQFWRLHAQRLLVERGQRDVAGQLAALVTEGKNPLAAVHALWALAGLRGTEPLAEFDAALAAAVRSASPAVRRAALQAMPRDAAGGELVAASGSLAHDEARVRLDALLALAEMPASARAAEGVVAALVDARNAKDRWIPRAATAAAARSPAEFLQAVAKAKPAAAAQESLAGAVRVVAEHYARGSGDAQLEGVLAALGGAEPAIAEAALAGLGEGWPDKRPPQISDRVSDDLAKLLGRLSGTGRAQLLHLAARWGLGEKFAALTVEVRKSLAEQLADESRSAAERLAAATNLAEMATDAESIGTMLEAITPRTEPEVAKGILEALGKMQAAGVGKVVVERWSKLTPATRPAAVALLMRRPEWIGALLDGLEASTVPGGDLGIEVEQRLSRHPNAALANRAKAVLARSGRVINADRQKVVEQLLPLAQRRGDAASGKLVFEMNCGKCHRHNGVGGQVGPDLTGTAARKKSEILLDVLDPNRSVEGNFQQYTVVTGDGQVLTGLLAAETRTAVELVDAEAKRHVVLREEIEELKGSKLSLMPEGFEKLRTDEIVNLLEFLAARGKYFPLPLGKVATVVTTKNVFFDSQSPIERLVFADWSPKTAFGVPFTLVDPQGDRHPNAVMLHGPQGDLPPHMPRSVTLPCNGPARSLHFLSGISGWGFPASPKGTTSMIVRLHYADGQREDHKLLNGEHFADYIRRVDVPESKFAFALRGQQLRYFAVQPGRGEPIENIELVKGDDASAPIVMAITVESP